VFVSAVGNWWGLEMLRWELTMYIYESVQVHITVIFALFADFFPVYSFADFFTLFQRFLLLKKKFIMYIQVNYSLVSNSQIVGEIVSLH
jgi:hypothetical protein